MIKISMFSIVFFITIFSLPASKEANYQAKALIKINQIRRRYFISDLKLNEKLQNSTQAYAEKLAHNDMGLKTTPNESLLECGRLVANELFNETMKFSCGEILAMELNLEGNPIVSCNLDALIGMWEGEEYFYNNKTQQNNALYQDNLKSFTQIISNSTIYFGLGVSISLKKQRCYVAARFWPLYIPNQNSKRIMDIYLYNTWSGPQSGCIKLFTFHKINVFIIFIIQAMIFF